MSIGSILRIVPLVAFPLALAIPHLVRAVLSPSSDPRGIAIAALIYYLSLLCVLLLTVALVAMKAKNQRTCRFSLKRLLGLVTAAAIGLAIFLNGSVFNYIVICLFTTAGVGWCLRVAIRAPQRDRAFCFGFSVVACMGISWSLIAPFPITETPLVTSMWWHLNGYRVPAAAVIWRNAFVWNGASWLANHCLFLTWLAAYCGGWLASAFASLKKVRPNG